MAKKTILSEIPFVKGIAVKPEKIRANGQVIFTDGTNTVSANQEQCEAYGYTYNKDTSTCTAYIPKTKININADKRNNKILGTNNSIGVATFNTQIVGQNNSTKGSCRNNQITGNKNEIQRGINNVIVSGTLAEATANNSFVLGGNAAGDNLAERQSIQLIYGTQTTAGSTVDSYLNNVTDSFFVIPDNTIMYFHADVVAVRVGGTNTGNTGDFASFVERGVVINKSGTLSISRERDAIKSSGTVTDWRPVANISGTNFRMTVRGETDVVVEWCSNITFTQIKTNVSL
tara:strand:+ start:1287 stop:2150 length:864 start_codon:yes stop_codon:yes gene_type:complete